MPFYQKDSLRYYAFDLLHDAGITHAIFTRRGGCSPAPWAGLNLGGSVGDDPVRVVENRRRALLAVDRSPASVYDVWQVHSADIICTEAPRPAGVPPIKADGILTNNPGVTLVMRFADCVPILLYDPVCRVVGLVHAGWMGTVRQAAGAAVSAMGQRFGSLPQNILAAVGPSIAAHHYPVGPEVVEQVSSVFGREAGGLLRSQDGAVQFDLWAANRLVLEKSGVQHIEVAGICTACHLEDWYSHRAEHGKTGRFGALIGL